MSNTNLSTKQDSSIDGFMVVDADDNIVFYNHRLVEMWDVPPELIEKKAIAPTLFIANKITDYQSFIQRVQYLYQHKEETSLEEIILKDGRVFDIYTAPMLGPGDKYYGRTWSFHDITERKHSEEEIVRINRTLRMLSDTNQALIRMTNEAELLNEACRIIIEVGGYQLAWIGFAEHGETSTLRPVAHAGYFSGYYGPTGISWADNKRGQNPEGIAIRTGQPYIGHNIPVDPLFHAWKDAAIEQGYKSVIALPLICEGQILGSLGIYSNQNEAFNASEIEILKEMASDMSFGINALRIKDMKSQAELALRDSEELLSVAFRSSPLAIAIFRAKDECIVNANEIYLKYCGLTLNEIIGRTNQELEFFMNHVDHDILLRKLHNEGLVKSFEFSARNKDNKIMFLSLSVSLFKIKKEEHYLAVFLDITERKKSEKALQDSEKKYRIVADNTYNWEYWTDPENNFIYCSPSCLRVTGYAANEFIEHPELIFEIVHPDHQPFFYNYVHKNYIEIQPEILQLKLIHKDGNVRWIEHICQSIFDADGKYLGRRGSCFDITEKKEIDRKILNTIIATEESERDKFSSELHDGLGPMLSIVKLSLQWISETPDMEQQKIIIETGLKNIDEAIQQVRVISNVLSPRILSNMGLTSAINHTISLINATRKLQINFTCDIERRYNSQIEITLYRIVSELINNTIKYANATKVEIKLSNYSNKNYVILTYSDDGIGFNFFKTFENKKGLGLHNIVQRVATLKGFINFDTDEGKPLIVTIELPLVKDGEHEQN